MYCPECDGDTKVVDSRRVEMIVARHRICKSCGHSFYTEEIEVENNDALRFYHSVAKAEQRKRGIK